MKKIIVVFAVLFTFFNTAAQSDHCKLPEDFDAYYRYGKANELLELWQNYVAKCAQKSVAEYTKGEQILQHEYDNAPVEFRKEKQIQLINYYLAFQQLFPDVSSYAMVKRAILVSEDKETAPIVWYQLLEEAFFKRNEPIDNPLALQLYFDTVLQLDTLPNKPINLVEAYLKVKVKALQYSTLFPAKAIEYENLIQYVNTHPVIKEHIHCEALEKYGQRILETKSTDFEMCLALTNEMYDKCRRKSAFLTAANYTYQLKINANSSFLIGMAKFSLESLESASPYFFAAVDQEEDTTVKAERASSLAQLYLGYNPGQSAALLKKAMQADPKNPNYPLLMAEIYQASLLFCDFKDKQADALYYLASQVALEAAKIDPKYTAASEKKALELMTKMKSPRKKTKKNSVYLGCWINQTVNW